MIREELEFRIAQYADGTLPTAQRPAVEAELAADAVARAVLAEYRQLRQAETAARLPLPDVRWDQLADRLSAVVAGAVLTQSEAAPSGPSIAASELGEQAEFVIACYADGTLDPAKRDEVEGLLASNGRARALLDEYENLDATTKAVAYNSPFPAVNWDPLAGRLSEAVNAGAAVALAEASERQVAEYARGPQGSLSLGEREEVEDRLESEPAARIALYEYRNLDAALQALPASAPVPSVNWEQLAGRISAAVDVLNAPDATEKRAEESAEERAKRPAASYPIRSWFRSPMRWATAASVLIAAGIGARLLLHGPGAVKPPPPVPPPPSELVVIGAQPEPASGSAVAEVQIGPPSQVAQGGDMDNESEDGVVSSPPRAFVASGEPAPKESDVLPAMPF